MIAGNHYGYNDSQTSPGSYWDAPDLNKGLAGILIVDSSNVSIDMQDSVSKGGSSYNGEINNNLFGGPGIEIKDSNNISINGGKSIGGIGISGFFITITGDIFITHDGGVGLFVTNSKVILNNHETTGGKGGEGNPEINSLPGQNGQPIYQDENSQIIYETSIPDWMLFSN